MSGAVAEGLVAAGVLPSTGVTAFDSMRLDPVPPAAGVARRFVASRLAGATPRQRDAAVLVASELVTNAVLHAGTTLEIGVAVVGERVLFAVSDRRSAHPRRGAADERTEGGRGLLVVDALVDGYGVVDHEDGLGKTVWVSVAG